MSFSLLPIIVAVTGHRDIPDAAKSRLSDRFNELLDKLASEYPSTPLAVLTGEAPGAEALAVAVANKRGIPVITASEPIGVHLAYYGHILVAFWDGIGEPSDGTAEVVHLRRSGIPAKHAASLGSYVPDVGPISQIVTPREGAPPPTNAYAVVEINPVRYDGDLTFARDFAAALHHYDTLSRDMEAHGVQPLSTPRDLMQCVDGLANGLQRTHLRILRGLYVLALVAGAGQLIVSDPRGLIWKIAVLAIAFICFLIARRLDFENRYQDYRALAEGLRVQQTWCDAGLQRLRVEASYLRMQQGELAWIRMALRTVYLLSVRGSLHYVDRAKVADWIEGQRVYYLDRTNREEQAAKRYHLLGAIATSVALAFSVAAIVNLLLKHAGHLAVLAGELTAIAALAALLLRFYVQQRGFRENARRYHHMFFVFDFAQRRLTAIGQDPPDELYNATVIELGREALAEHASWLVLHRERPLSFVSS